jgi:hypothetical protein
MDPRRRGGASRATRVVETGSLIRPISEPSSTRAWRRVAASLGVIVVVSIGATAAWAASPTSSPLAPSPASSASPAKVPFGAGDIFAGIGAGKFNHFSATGALLATLDDGQTTPGENATTGMCFDAAGDMYATNVRANSMSKFSQDGSLLAATVGTFHAQPESCLVVDGTTIFASEVQGTGDILKLDLSGKQLANYDVPRSDWIDLAADRCTMFYTDESPRIHRFDVCANAPLTDFVTSGGGYFALRILPDGTVLVAATSAVKRFSSSGVQIASYTAAREGYFFALNLDPDGQHFWSGGLRTGIIYEFALDPVGPPVLSFDAMVRQSGGTELAGLAVFGEIVASQATPSAPVATSEAATPTVPPSPENAPPWWLLVLVLVVLALIGVLLAFGRRRRSRPRAPGE